ncbi:glycogen synthase [Parapedobacter pyrenivorans]|uniref:starch synthase n=1 Tax=Parapedobacter pyrenivorans TaxID=1305674 RepID=A0A917HDW4_9SPHI|nr:glycogen/starch synthase [Parapedobacter pyrenivorans]GGG74813.1 glycogen synthase [Parapedobacter pyrenivorans]
MAKTKILFVTHEMSPFLELSKISEITRQLPQAMQEKGYEIRILMPRFGNINERRNRLHEVIRLSGMNIVVDNNDNPLIIKVASIPAARMQVYFLDNEEYFQRKHVFCDDCGKFFEDNNERTVFFCKGALETVKKLGWAPDVVHCHGWMSALVPAYLKTAYKDDPTFKDAKVIYSLYKEEVDDFSLGENFADIALTGDMTEDDVAHYGSGDYAGLYQGALAYSDAVVLSGDDLDQQLLNIVKKSDIPVFEVENSEEFENYCNLYEQFASVELEAAVEA